VAALQPRTPPGGAGLSKRPLFSTYSQGENRVTGSLMAVFERLDLGTLERILAGAAEESSLQLVSFDLVRPEGTGRVPDARIAASFKYLFETKTAYDALDEAQLRGHLDHLGKGGYADERLFALTPDTDEPSVIGRIADERLRWMSFVRLDEAIREALAEDEIPDDERFLLRELRALFVQEGLLGRQETVVVAAANAYDFYLKYSAYVCQADRSFRNGLERLAFYRRRRIEIHVPQILKRVKNVEFSCAEALKLRASSDPLDARVADVIEGTVAAGARIDSHPYQVFILTPPTDPATFRLANPIRHESDGRGSAFTMGQRYVYFADMERSPETTAGLR
jgi:hypothetical protein